MTDVIDVMCRAYWNARGSFRWENEPNCQRELIRERMRAALAAYHTFNDAVHIEVRRALEQKTSENEQPVLSTTVLVPAPVSDPNRVLFSNPPLHSMADYATKTTT